MSDSKEKPNQENRIFGQRTFAYSAADKSLGPASFAAAVGVAESLNCDACWDSGRETRNFSEIEEGDLEEMFMKTKDTKF